jgi:serine/threonine protein kinase
MLGSLPTKSGVPVDAQRDSIRWRVGRLSAGLVVACGAFVPLRMWVDASLTMTQAAVSDGLALLTLAGAATMAAVAYGALLSDGALTRLALAWSVATAWLLELSVGAAPVVHGGRAAPWSSVWILLFPVAVGAPPRWSAVAVGFAALAGPLSMFAWSALGVPMPPFADFAGYTLASMVIAGAALVPLGTTWRLRQRAEVARAQVEHMGCYELEQRIGVGGGGEVWKARHAMLARHAAVKLIKIDRLPLDPRRRAFMLDAFRQEAEITARLQCPHTVVVFDFGLSPAGPLYIVMELVDGVDLRRLSAMFGALPPARVAFLLAQVCESLGEAHALGLVHADVKPANIMVSRRGGKADFVKVLDFGLAHRWNEPGADDAATIRGTPAFMAPEVSFGEPADPRSDIYSLGCVAWSLLTGRPLFPSTTTVDQLRDHQSTAPEPPSRYSPFSVPPALDALVLQCLEKSPEQRPKSMIEVRDRLGGLAFGRPWTQRQADAWWEEHTSQLQHPTEVHTPGRSVLMAADPRRRPSISAWTSADYGP